MRYFIFSVILFLYISNAALAREECMVSAALHNQAVKISELGLKKEKFYLYTEQKYISSKDYGEECGFRFEIKPKADSKIVYVIESVEVVLKKQDWAHVRNNIYEGAGTISW